MRAAEDGAVHGNHRVNAGGVVNGYRLLEMIARGGELAHVTVAQPYHPVRLHKQRLVPEFFRKAQALFPVLESAFVFGSHNINYRQAELRAKKLRDVVQLQAELACSDESLL